jgi:alkylation response protein AidB-like acyl-CoA dehydrogenase
MDFNLTDDQQLLQESVQRLLAGEYSFERRKQILGSPLGFDEGVWKAMAGQGLLAIGLPEDHGGFGGTVETMVVMEELGKSLVLEPFMTTTVLCGGLLRDYGSPSQQADIFPRLIAGERRIAFAHFEPHSRYTLDSVQTTARDAKSVYVISGKKSVVLDGGVAHQLIVSARVQPEGRLALFLLDAQASGVKVVRYRTQDGRSAADVELTNVEIQRENLLPGSVEHGINAVERAIHRAIAALCAEAVGGMEALIQATSEYLKSRKQFGQPIGRFQVLQHRMADMYVMSTQARSMSLLATGRCDSSDDAARRRAISSAKAFVGQAARFVGQQAIQLHGGMGMTDELTVGHYFKRLTMINMTFGDPDHHVAALSDALLTEGT